MLAGPKCAPISHCVFGKYASGVPFCDRVNQRFQLKRIRGTQLSVSIEPMPFATSAGVSLLSLPQNHTLMKLSVRSSAYLQLLLVGP